jgi:hypothetical protein
MTSFIREVKSIGSCIAFYTLAHEMSISGDLWLKKIVETSQQMFNFGEETLSFKSRAYSVVYSGVIAVSALTLYLMQPIINARSIQFLFDLLKMPIDRCTRFKIGLVAAACLSIYSGIKHYALDDSRVGFFVGRVARAVGMGAVVGLLDKSYLGFVSFYLIHLAEYYQRQKESDNLLIEIHLDLKDATVGDQRDLLITKIDRIVGVRQKDEGTEFSDAETILSQSINLDFQKRQAIGKDLSKEDLLRLLPQAEHVDWGQLTSVEKINMFFLMSGIYVLSDSLSDSFMSKDLVRQSDWLQQFSELCRENASVDARKQLALAFFRSDD